jgi:hypothetical protein
MAIFTDFSFLRFHKRREDKVGFAVGGTIINAVANATLLTGDIVYVDGAGTVNKSATSANYAGFVGVVVGGPGTRNSVETDALRTGLTAGTSGQTVLVQVSGIARVVAEGTVTPGTHFSVISTGTTAGRVIAGTTAGQMVGVPLTAGTSGTEMLILLDHR